MHTLGIIRIFVKICAALFLHSIFIHAVKRLFLLGVQDLHDLIVTSTLLIQLCLLCKRLLNQLFLLCQIVPGFGQLLFPLLHLAVHALYSCNQVVDHKGGVVRISIETVSLLTGDQALNAFMGLNNTKIEACKLTDSGIAGFVCLGSSRSHQRRACVLLLGKGLLAYGNREFTIRIGIYSGSQIGLAVSDVLFQAGNGALVLFQAALGIGHSCTVRTVQTFQLLDIGVQLYLLHNQRTAGCKRFNLSSGKCYFSGVLSLTAYILTVHNLVNEILLSFQDIP